MPVMARGWVDAATPVTASSPWDDLTHYASKTVATIPGSDEVMEVLLLWCRPPSRENTLPVERFIVQGEVTCIECAAECTRRPHANRPS